MEAEVGVTPLFIAAWCCMVGGLPKNQQAALRHPSSRVSAVVEHLSADGKVPQLADIAKVMECH